MRIVAPVLGLLVLAGAMLAPPAAYAADKNTPVTVLTTEVPKFLPGQQAWVSVLLKGGNIESCDVRVTGVLNGASVSYPTNTSTFTAPYRDANLAAGEIDFVALNVSVPATMNTPQIGTLTVSYNTCDYKNNGSDKGNGNKNGHQGQEISFDMSTSVPIAPFVGTPLQQTTLSLGSMSPTAPKWVSVGFTGSTPAMTNFRFQITDAAGAKITYPKDGTDTGLALGPDLLVLRPDSAAFNIDVAGLTPGLHTMKTKVTYGAARTSVAGTLTFTVV